MLSCPLSYVRIAEIQFFNRGRFLFRFWELDGDGLDGKLEKQSLPDLKVFESFPISLLIGNPSVKDIVVSNDESFACLNEDKVSDHTSQSNNMLSGFDLSTGDPVANQLFFYMGEFNCSPLLKRLSGLWRSES